MASPLPSLTVPYKPYPNSHQVNTLGPLRVQQALTDQMAKPGGKVLIISTGMGSITDNGSGGLYAYRSSKAAVNMLMKNMSLDLKALEISVISINPGMCATDFGPGAEALASFGAMPVEDSVAQLLQIFDMCAIRASSGPLTRRAGCPRSSPAASD